MVMPKSARTNVTQNWLKNFSYSEYPWEQCRKTSDSNDQITEPNVQLLSSFAETWLWDVSVRSALNIVEGNRLMSAPVSNRRLIINLSDKSEWWILLIFEQDVTESCSPFPNFAYIASLMAFGIFRYWYHMSHCNSLMYACRPIYGFVWVSKFLKSRNFLITSQKFH